MIFAFPKMTSLQKGQFTQFSVQKWDKVVNNDIKLRSKVKSTLKTPPKWEESPHRF
jgi:hypothetical protein